MDLPPAWKGRPGAGEAGRLDLPPAGKWAPTLTDGVVRLRAHDLGDVEALLAQCRDPQMQRWTTVPVPYERHHAVDWLRSRREEWEAGRYLALAIEDGGGFCGTVDLRPDGAGGARIGYGLGPWARGRGVLHRALRLILPWGFGTVGLEVVHWEALAGNWASRRAAWRAGFRVEGTVRSWLAHRGGRYDAWVGSLRRDDPLRPAHPWFDVPVLGGLRVRLRPYRAEDVPRAVEACSDPVTRHWLARLPSPYTADDARAHLEQMTEDAASGHSLCWAVAAADDDRLVGEIALFGLAEPGRSSEVGYWGHPAERGRGFLTEAARLAARHALLPLDVGGLGRPRLVLRAAGGNGASQRVAQRAGFRRTGIDRRAELLGDGTADDLVRYDLLPEELVLP
jgi:RimJ/RimL family protein N-acetyltransferase